MGGDPLPEGALSVKVPGKGQPGSPGGRGALSPGGLGNGGGQRGPTPQAPRGEGRSRGIGQLAGVACGWAGDGGRGEKRRRGTARAWSRRLAHRVGQPASWHAVKIMGGSVHPSAVSAPRSVALSCTN